MFRSVKDKVRMRKGQPHGSDKGMAAAHSLANQNL
jgi:hypothetical protein